MTAVAAVMVAEVAVFALRPRNDLPDPAPVDEHAYFSDAQLAEAHDFRGNLRVIGLGAMGVELVLLGGMALWRPAPLRRVLDGTASRPVLGGAAVGAGLSLALALAGTPLAALAHDQARDVGLSTQALGPWLGDRAKAVGIGAGLAALGGASAVAVMRRSPKRWWVAGSVLVIGYGVVFTWLAPTLLAPVFNKFEELPPGQVRSDVEELGAKAGVDVGHVYRIDASRRSTALNAYVDGIGSSKRVVLYDNLINDATPAELRSVVAHELGHVHNHDVPRGILWLAIVAPLALLAAQQGTEAIGRRTGDEPGTPSILPALALSIAIASAFLGSASNQLSRAVEREADEFALELTHDPQSLIAIQRRLAITNIGDPSPPAVTQFLFGTHPSTVERIGQALSYERVNPNPAARGQDQPGDP